MTRTQYLRSPGSLRLTLRVAFSQTLWTSIESPLRGCNLRRLWQLKRRMQSLVSQAQPHIDTAGLPVTATHTYSSTQNSTTRHIQTAYTRTGECTNPGISVHYLQHALRTALAALIVVGCRGASPLVARLVPVHSQDLVTPSCIAPPVSPTG